MALCFANAPPKWGYLLAVPPLLRANPDHIQDLKRVDVATPQHIVTSTVPAEKQGAARQTAVFIVLPCNHTPTLSLLSFAVAFSWSSTHLRASSFLQMLARSVERPFWLAQSCNGPPSAAGTTHGHQHELKPCHFNPTVNVLECHRIVAMT